MSAKKKHITVNEYLQYLKGELSNLERHSLERDLEADPFLREAMEGLESVSPEMAEEDLLSLHSRLSKRLARRRRIGLYSIAATVASLLIVGTIFLQVHDFNPNKRTGPSYMEEPAADDQEGPANVDQGETARSIPEKEEVQEEEEPTEMDLGKPSQVDVREPAGIVQGEPVGAEQGEQVGVVQGKEQKSIPDLEEAEANEEPVMYLEAEPVTKEKSGETGADRVERVVMDKAAPVAMDRAEPVSGEEIEPSAPVKVEEAEPLTMSRKRETKGIRTESPGQPAAARAPEMQKATLYKEESGQPEAEEVSGVLISSEDTESLAAPVGTISTSPEPVGGYDAYKAYIEENIKFPPEDTTTRKAVVILKFTVTVSGDITNVEVLRHSGDPFAKEAIRLLEEGPPWNPAADESGPVEDVVRLKILFKR